MEEALVGGTKIASSAGRERKSGGGTHAARWVSHDKGAVQLLDFLKSQVSEAASEEASKLLPDFVVAWMLLQRSGLDSVERSVIVANLKNQFTTHRVREALKLTWPDEELRRRDATRQSALFESMEWEEGEEAYQAFELEARNARRTLRDARERQSMMRRNRKFYPNGSNRDQGGERRPPLRCFRCGGPHLKKDCPEKRAHFVFSAARATGKIEKESP